MSGQTIREVLAAASRLLEGRGTRLEAEVLLAHVLACSRAQLYAAGEGTLEESARVRFEGFLNRRLHGEPLAYLLGYREFWSLVLKVTPETLIPRAETEHLVEQALIRLPTGAGCRIADLGTGSGAVALALATERPHCRVLATDASAGALMVAAENVRALGLFNLTLRQGDWCEALGRERFGLIVSNPPYVAGGDPHLSQGDLRFEPSQALVAGPDGLDAIRRIVRDAPDYLKPDGGLLLEHGYEQGRAVRTLLGRRGFVGVTTHIDLAGLERVTGGTWTRNP